MIPVYKHAEGCDAGTDCTCGCPPWIECVMGCGNPWCELHEKHAFECDCPPMEEWEERMHAHDRTLSGKPLDKSAN